MTGPCALYTGTVHHKRFAPKVHALRYRMMMALLDLDELDRPGARPRLFSRNRFNLFSFYDRDHLDPGDAGSLQERVRALLDGAGLSIPGGSIQLLALPRILGFAFNPISVYFCRRADQSLAAVLYEVHNTFRERHSYLIPVEAAAAIPLEQSCAKNFYVSPFMDMEMRYAFRVLPPGEAVSIAVDGMQNGARMIVTSFAGTRRPFTDGQLLRTFFGHPLIAFAVVAGIYWEALKIWLKGVGLRARPAPPLHSVSIVAASAAAPTITARDN